MTKGFALVAFVLIGLVMGSNGAHSKVFPYKVNEVILDNGLKVVSVPYDSPGLIAYYTVVRAGSRNEVEPGRSGFAHFFEHMMFRGTEKYPSDKYDEILQSYGIDDNAFTTDDYTCYHLVGTKDALETIIDLESDRFKNLKYSEEAFRKEAGAVLGEYNMNSSNPFLIMFEKLHDNAYTTHTYKHTTMGFLQDIENMPNLYNYSLQFHDRYYRPDNSIIVVVGDFDQDTLIRLVKKYYGDWERSDYKVDIPVEPPQTEEKTAHITWDNPTMPILLIGYHGPAFSDRQIDMPALDLMSQLAFSESSPLYRKLVVEEAVVEFIYGGCTDHRDPPLFTIVTRIKDEQDMERVREEIFAAIEETIKSPVSEERLAEIKSHMKYNFAMGLDTPGRIAGTLAHYLQMTADYETVNRVYMLYDQVTPQDVMDVAQQYFGVENRTIVTLTYGGEK
ncbi:MAG: insulinase family protein [Gemmatimonadota bacterium]|nr:MAG: insulinase family protein [Gemmatimonadota bacterium]